MARIRKGEIPRVRIFWRITGDKFLFLRRVIFTGIFLPVRNRKAKAQDTNWAINCGDSCSGYIHMKSENKYRIQQDIGQRAYDHRKHADPGKALAGNEIVQPHSP